ncbi:esterase-like activity of phytase family protein [Ramlibacter sp. H39-3-26]|uniref:esterase-like activity of phytase family protein n=1 Tax=Curvibacter soli TaxID=3031331 RepID=UPI0023DB8022|nr:esterase-like activity of phytase family protein [Ramlibacter sp. H39-3-26]MDF1485435.1 esterase-like activity of phytase family protein [Ramlibacter sp. H39-3-26]
MKKSAIALAVGVALSGLLTACGGSDDDPVDVPSVSNPGKFFNRLATFAVCSQVGASCEDSTPTAAEIVAVSEDGMTLVYTNSLKGEVGFVDIGDPANPKALGRLAMGGEPTSVTVLGSHALVAVNTSQNFINASGKLVVVDIAKRTVVTEIQLGGQPDSVARSMDGKYVAVVIENERDESLGNGAPPQAPSGYLTIVDSVGAPATWKTRVVELKGLATLFPEDAEPEYVSINDDNVAVVTLQENNHIALVDLASGKVTRHFSAGAVTLNQVDLTDAPRPNIVSLTQTQANRLREPDGVTWFSKTQFATANEGDLNGGSRGFTIFNSDGTVVYDAGNTLEHLIARIGHTNDKRSDAKGNEPENVAFGRFDGTDYLFVASERSSVLAVYDMGQKNQPMFKQVLPAALAPEGVLAVPSRNLLIAASENDDRATSSTLRSALNIYQYQSAPAAYPTIQSVNRADGTPIPWSAMSGLVAATSGTVVYGVDDSFFRGNRIFEIDTSVKPASLKREIRITDPNGKIAALAAALPAAKDANAFDATDLAALVNPDGSVNLDPEGISLASAGGFWVASEGNGTVGEAARPVLSANLVFKLSAIGVIEDIIELPADVNAKQQRFGFEGIAESNGKLVVAFQRAWAGESQPRIGVYDLAAKTWQFMFYPLDAVTSPNKGWVGLSDITALGNNRFLVIERDNQGGPDARVKKLYRIDLSGVANGATLSKTLVRDVLPDLRKTNGLVVEKIEGLAVLANGDALLVNDNDGVDDNNGETWLLNLGKLNLN